VATPRRVVVDAFLAAGVDCAHTRRAYARHLADALTVMDDATLAELSGADLAHHRALVDAGLSPASQGQALAALHSCLRWSGAMGAHRLSGDVVATALRTPRAVVRRPYTVASEAEIARLFAVAATPRDRAILGVLLGAGLASPSWSGSTCAASSRTSKAAPRSTSMARAAATAPCPCSPADALRAAGVGLAVLDGERAAAVLARAAGRDAAHGATDAVVTRSSS
jgi:hypothetical protein